MKKRWFSFLLSLLMVLSVMPLSAFALGTAETVDLTISEQSGKTQVKVGDTLTYTVTIGEVTNLAALQFTLVIPSQLEFVSASESVPQAEQKEWDGDAKHLKAYGMQYSSSASTKLLTVTCRAVSGGSAKLSVQDDIFVCYEGGIFDKEHQQILTAEVNSSVVAVSSTSSYIPEEEEVDEGENDDKDNSATIQISGDKTTVKTEASVSGSTATIDAPTSAQLNKIVDYPNKNGSVVLDLSKLDDSVEKVNLPMSLIKKVAEEAKKPNSDLTSLEVKLPSGSVVLDAKILHTIVAEAEGNQIRLVLDEVGTKQLNNAQKAAISAMDVYGGYEAYLYCVKSNRRISDFNGGVATLSVPFKVPAGKSANDFSVWYVSDNGKMERLSTWYANKRLYWDVSHFSDFVIVYDKNSGEKANPETGAVI